MFKGFHHIGLYVADTARSLKFYQEGMCGKVINSFGSPERTIYMVELAPGAVVELIPKDEVPTANSPWAHICMASEDVRADFDRAVAAGATVKSAPPEGEYDGKRMFNAFVIGPDGESIEFMQV